MLRPRGGLAVLWNEPVKPVEPAVGEAADAVMDEAIARGGEPGGPRYRSGVWREHFATAPFEELREAHHEVETTVGREELIAYVLSISSVASLPREERAAIAARVEALIEQCRYRRFLRCDLYWTRLTDAKPVTG